MKRTSTPVADRNNRFRSAVVTLLGCLAFAHASLHAQDAPATDSGPEPATVEQFQKVLDLRKFPRIDNAKPGGMFSASTLMYEANLKPKPAFDFQRNELTKLGFKELPGGYSDDNNNSGHFTKDNFTVVVSTSPSYSEPKKEGWSNVTLINQGNVDLKKLPVPAGVTPFFPGAMEASYLTNDKVPETAETCRKLLLAAGWEPYGQNPPQPDSTMHYFKRNAIKILCWVSTAPAQGGKTVIRYSSELMSADLPAPPDAKDPRYDDQNKKLDMDEPTAKTDAILAYYMERLPKMGWKATTEKPVSDAKGKSQFMIFRNEAKELLSLDLTQFTGIVRVKLQHQTEEELAAEEKRAKEYAEKKKREDMERNRKITVSLPLPSAASKIEKTRPNRIEFAVPKGTGQQTFEAFSAYFKKEGWKTEREPKFDKNTGNLDLKKDKLALRFSYFDIGVGGADVTVTGTPNVVFEVVSDSLKVAPSKEKTPSTKTAKKKPTVPGIPELPEGVEIPKEASDLLEKAKKDLEELDPPKPESP